jgi:Tat protein translocase TatB subunit
MLNVGPLELLVVLAVALIVVGPERLPELARSVGRALRQFREVQDEVREMVSSSVDDDTREVVSEFRKAASGVKRATDVKGAVRRTERSIREETAPTPRPTRPEGTSSGSGAEPGPAASAPEQDPPHASPNGEQGREDRSTP